MKSTTLNEHFSPVNVILDRRSIRRYQQKTIPKDVFDKILEAGRQAPSAANRQPWHFIIVTDDEIKKELSRSWFNLQIRDSAFTVVGCAYTGLKHIGTRRWSIIDTTIALQNMVIAAWTLGVGSCWIGDFNEDKVKTMLKIPNNWKVVALISFGYPAEKPHPKRKKPLDKIVNFNKF